MLKLSNMSAVLYCV